MTNKHHTVLYIGVTSDLVSRVQQHISKLHPTGFTANTILKNWFTTVSFPQLKKPSQKKSESKEEVEKRDSIN